MCFDTRSSLLAFYVSWNIALYLYFRNRNYDRWLSCFIVIFSTVQLLEAGIWQTMGEPNMLNELLTKCLLLVLVLQPLVQSFMGYKYTDAPVLGYLSLVCLGLVLYGLYLIYTQKFKSVKGPGGHLVWKRDGNLLISSPLMTGIYLIGIFLPLFFMKDYKYVPLVTVGLLTALFSWKATMNSDEMGSLWCYFAVFYSVASLII